MWACPNVSIQGEVEQHRSVCLERDKSFERIKVKKEKNFEKKEKKKNFFNKKGMGQINIAKKRHLGLQVCWLVQNIKNSL